MTPVIPFPLLKLPSLAIIEVLKGMERFELVQLSLASEKITSILESLAKGNSSKKNYKLKLDIDDNYERPLMRLNCKEREFLVIKFKSFLRQRSKNVKDAQLSKVSLMFGNIRTSVKVHYHMNTITVYWENYFVALGSMLQYFLRTFDPVTSIEYFIGKEYLALEVLKVIEKVNARLDEVSMGRFFTSGHVYQKLFELPIQQLSLLSSLCDNFQYKPSAEPIKVTKLQIADAEWVTNLEDFLHCKNVTLRNLKLTGKDFNKFLKKWIESDSQLEYANMSGSFSQVLELRSILEGLPAKLIGTANISPYDILNFEDGECFGLQRINGEEAIVYRSDKSSIIIQAESFQGPLF